MWQAFGASRQLKFYPATGSIFTRRAARLEGTSQDVPVTIDTYTVSTGKTSTTYTRVTANAIEPIQVKAKVYREHVLSGLGDMLGFQDVKVGDEIFDGTCVVKADDESVVQTLLDKEVRQALLELFATSVRGCTFQYDKGDIKVVWLGAEPRADILAAAVDAASAAGRFRGVAPKAFR